MWHGTCSKTICMSRTCKLTVFVIHWRRFFLNSTRHIECIRGTIFAMMCYINWHLHLYYMMNFWMKLWNETWKETAIGPPYNCVIWTLSFCSSDVTHIIPKIHPVFFNFSPHFLMFCSTKKLYQHMCHLCFHDHALIAVQLFAHFCKILIYCCCVSCIRCIGICHWC